MVSTHQPEGIGTKQVLFPDRHRRQFAAEEAEV
jgi:hypothetical protein